MFWRSLKKSIKLFSLFCFLGSELELKRKKTFFCIVRITWHKGRAVEKEKAEGSSEQVCRSQKWLVAMPPTKCSNMKNVLGEQPWHDNSNMAAILDEGHVPDTLLGSSVALFYSVLIISIAIFLHLHN